MLAVVYAVVREKEKVASSMTVWDVFRVLLGRTFVSGFRTKKPKTPKKPIFKKPVFLQPRYKISRFCLRPTNYNLQIIIFVVLFIMIFPVLEVIGILIVVGQ